MQPLWHVTARLSQGNDWDNLCNWELMKTISSAVIFLVFNLKGLYLKEII